MSLPRKPKTYNKYFAVFKRYAESLLFLLILPFLFSCQPSDRYIVLKGYAQGGSYSVKLNARNVTVPDLQLKVGLDSLFSDIDFSLSGYNKGSLLSRLNAGERIHPDKMLIELYDRSYEIYEASGGAFDVSSAPLFDVWGFGFTSDSLPSFELIRSALAKSGMNRLKSRMEDALDSEGSLTASDLLLDPSGVAPVLNFNAIAQGYSCDVVSQYLDSMGASDMLVDIGEIFCRGRNPSGKSWAIGIDRPEDGNNTPGAKIEEVWHSSVSGAGQGVVTSGNYRKYYVVDGCKYSHTIDPRTGYPVKHNLLSATVVAPDATTADAVATWCMVAGLSGSMQLLKEQGLEACLIYDDGGEMKSWMTDSFITPASR